MDNEEDQEIESLFPGFSNQEGTWPGFQSSSEMFRVEFVGVEVEHVANSIQTKGEKVPVKSLFESCYDWKPVMSMILESLEKNVHLKDRDFHKDLEGSIKEWLNEFGGFGLRFELHHDVVRKFLNVLYLHLKNREDGFAERTKEAQYKEVMGLYKSVSQTAGMGFPLNAPMSQLVPKVEATLIKNRYPDSIRRKTVKIEIFCWWKNIPYELFMIFTVEKIRLRRTLVEHSAEVVAKQFSRSDNLEIPRTLKCVVNEKIIDRNWILSRGSHPEAK